MSSQGGPSPGVGDQGWPPQSRGTGSSAFTAVRPWASRGVEQGTYIDADITSAERGRGSRPFGSPSPDMTTGRSTGTRHVRLADLPGIASLISPGCPSGKYYI